MNPEDNTIKTPSMPSIHMSKEAFQKIEKSLTGKEAHISPIGEDSYVYMKNGKYYNVEIATAEELKEMNSKITTTRLRKDGSSNSAALQKMLKRKKRKKSIKTKILWQLVFIYLRQTATMFKARTSGLKN